MTRLATRVSAWGLGLQSMPHRRFLVHGGLRPAGDGESLVVVRLIFGSAMLASIVLAVFAIRRRDFPGHGAWMTRGYAIALGAGTQVFTMLPWVVIFGPIGAADELPRTLLMTAGRVINLGVAEYVIHRRPRPGHRSNRTSAGL